MRQLTFKSRIALWFSTVLAISLLISGLLFAVLYFGVTLVNMQNFMLREAKEVTDKNMTQQDGQIFFKKDDQGKTLSAYLRDEGLSAMIFDKKYQLLGAYGVYNGLLEIQDREKLVSTADLQKSFVEGKHHFNFYNLYEGRMYLTLIHPQIYDDEVLGIMVLGSDMDFGRQMLIFSLILLAIVLPVSFVLGWLATHWVIGRSFQPLESVLSKMDDLQIEKLPTRLNVKGNLNDEIVRLSKSYNNMIYRIGEGIQKQKEFVTNASHELKTPLTESILDLDLIEMEVKDNRIEKALAKISGLRDDLKKYGELINSLLELSRIKQEDIKHRKIKVRYFMESVAEGLARVLKERNMKIKLEIPNDSSFRFPEDYLEIMVSNLLSNAVKYGKKRSTIVVQSGVSDEKGFLKVTNDISDKDHLDIKKIWRRFQRGTNRKIDGYGVGLSVVKEVAKKNKLSISNSVTKDKKFEVMIKGFEIA